MRSGMPPSSRSRYGAPGLAHDRPGQSPSSAPAGWAAGSRRHWPRPGFRSDCWGSPGTGGHPAGWVWSSSRPRTMRSGAAAAELARDGGHRGRQVVLHLSGLLDRLALHALAFTGAGLGSFHPLQSIADPATAPGACAGAFAGLEGDDRALDAGERLARGARHAAGPARARRQAGVSCGSGLRLELRRGAGRRSRAVGAPGGRAPAEDAASLYLPLMRGTVANLDAGGGGGADRARSAGATRRRCAATWRRSSPSSGGCIASSGSRRCGSRARRAGGGSGRRGRAGADRGRLSETFSGSLAE